MSAAARADAAGVVSLALAFHRAPASHADLLHGIAPLPEPLGVLLRLAAGASPADVSPAIVPLASPNDLRIAALFFIEQVLFRHDANYFRMLGLNPGAGLEQIKEHHRLLMRLFHPDRENQLGDADGEWKEAHATRVNLAYNTLRDVDSRRRYLAGLKSPPARPVVNAAVPRVAVRRMAASPDSFWAIHLEPLFKRYLPQWVLGGTALLALLLVGAVHLANPQIEVTDSTQAGGGVAPVLPVKSRAPVETLPSPLPVIDEARHQALSLDAAIARFENRVKDVAALAPAPAQPPRPAVKQPGTQAMQATAKPTVWVSGRAHPSTTPAGSVMAVSPVAGDGMIATAVVETRPAPALPAIVQAAPQAPVQIAQVAQPVSMPTPVPWNPDTLLVQMAEAYERGDAQDLMDIFDDAVRTNAGGRAETQRDYEALFRSTDLRYLKLDNISWSGEGDMLKGQGKYRMTQMRKGESVLKTQSGAMRIELVRRGRSVLISTLYLTSGRP